MQSIKLFVFYLSIAGLCLCLLACGGGPKTPVEVTVLNRENEQPLDSASVLVLKSYPGGDAEVKDTLWTDEEGRLTFNLISEKGYQYSLQADRKHYIAALAASGGNYENEAPLELGDSNRVILYLEPIELPDPSRLERSFAAIPVKEVVAAIRGDSWTWSFLPELTWEDIPSLLEVGADTTFLHQYPRDPRSNYQPDSVSAGVTALWLIEAIRRQAGTQEQRGGMMPPGRAPVLGTRYGNPSGYNSPAQVRKAHGAYLTWWTQHGEDPDKASRRQPLRGTGLGWM